MALSILFVAFFVIAFVVALIRLIFFQDVTIFPELINSTMDMSKLAVEISLGMIGLMALWLGLMRIGEKAGLIDILGKAVRPFFRKLFPSLPEDHPAFGSMLMNIAANMLGLDNAATPLGLKAMSQLQEANPEKDTASNAQIMFLVINTSGLCVIPVSIMMFRAQAGALNPSDVFIPIILTTFFSTLAGIIACGIIQKIKLYDKVILSYLGGMLALVIFLLYSFSRMDKEQVKIVTEVAGNVILFSIIIAFILFGLYKKINIFETFIEGAKEGFNIAVRIIPYIVGMLVIIGVFRTSGALNYLTDALAALFNSIGINADFVQALPTALMKPLSGSGARGLMIEAMNNFGADSFTGRLSCLFNGSTDTTFYILAVYFGSVGIRKTRYAVPAGLIADGAGIIAAIVIGYIFFG